MDSGGHDFVVCGRDNPELICPICFLLLKDTRELPCTHTICTKCLLNWEVEQGSING